MSSHQSHGHGHNSGSPTQPLIPYPPPNFNPQAKKQPPPTSSHHSSNSLPAELYLPPPPPPPPAPAPQQQPAASHYHHHHQEYNHHQPVAASHYHHHHHPEYPSSYHASQLPPPANAYSYPPPPAPSPNQYYHHPPPQAAPTSAAPASLRPHAEPNRTGPLDRRVERDPRYHYHDHHPIAPSSHPHSGKSRSPLPRHSCQCPDCDHRYLSSPPPQRRSSLPPPPVDRRHGDHYQRQNHQHAHRRRDSYDERLHSKTPRENDSPQPPSRQALPDHHRVSRSPAPQAQPPPPSRTPKPRSLVRRGTYFTEDRIDKFQKFLEKRAEMNIDEILEQEKKVWTRSAPADLYYERDRVNPIMMRAKPKLMDLCDKFKKVCIEPSKEAAKKFPAYEPPRIRRLLKKCKGSACHGKACKGRGGAASDNSSSSGSSSSEEEEVKEKRSKSRNKNKKKNMSKSKLKEDTARAEALRWLTHRQKQPFRLDEELWENQPGELNDGPACRCSAKAKKIGIRHGIYQGEEDDHKAIKLDPMTNNADRLYHYRITISPPTNYIMESPTVITHDGHDFVFEGFSLLTTKPIGQLPSCNVVRFNIRYEILYIEEKVPDNFTLRELELFHEYFFRDLLELADWQAGSRFHFMPRFVRDLSEDGKEILSMNEVLRYLVDSRSLLVEDVALPSLLKMDKDEWLAFTDGIRGMIVTHPGMRPSGLRVDQLDRCQDREDVIKFPDIVHIGQRPAQLYYAGNAEYQKAWREYMKFRHLLANKDKPTYDDRQKLEVMSKELVKFRQQADMKREVTVALSSQGFEQTGLMADIVQHGLLLPVLVNHLRLHASLDRFEERIRYKFRNRRLLQLAMTHPSYKENYGTTPDHVRNALSNCGIRQPEYGDKKVHFSSSRKRGINVLINIMSRFGRRFETESRVQHNERLEFLGDAVVEFISSVHLYYMFPDLEEGGLATFRAALVQNQHLAMLAGVLELEKYMLYAHGSDLCHDAELRHAMANCFEAVMGAIFLDGGIVEADRIFGKTLFGHDETLYKTWTELKHHPLQAQEPAGDRHWISTYPILQTLTKFEEATGVEFTHIRLLARSFTDRSLGLSNLTLGSNQRMEFLGDTVLQLVTSDYLYKHFPDHHEGHLSLLRSSVVNNRTQAVVADDLGMVQYALYSTPKADLKTKDKADLLEAYIGALYVDKDLEYCRKFAEVCFFPRLRQFILKQEWNDPKSKLQQCCLTLRQMNGREPDIPEYKVTECKGPTNTRTYGVVVYFRGERLAKAHGQSIQEAEMNAASKALKDCGGLFPHLEHQKVIVERSFQRQGVAVAKEQERENILQTRKELGLDKAMEEKERIWKEKTEGLTKEQKQKLLLEEAAKRREEKEQMRWEEHLEELRNKNERRRQQSLEIRQREREEWLKKNEREKQELETRMREQMNRVQGKKPTHPVDCPRPTRDNSQRSSYRHQPQGSSFDYRREEAPSIRQPSVSPRTAFRSSSPPPPPSRTVSRRATRSPPPPLQKSHFTPCYAAKSSPIPSSSMSPPPAKKQRHLEPKEEGECSDDD